MRENREGGERAQVGAAPYYRLLPQPDHRQDNPYRWIEMRAQNAGLDDVYKDVEPIPRWLVEGCPLFTDIERWNRMIRLSPGQKLRPDTGLITISGFRRPDFLTGFARVTIMAALFRHTMLYAVWSQLGVDFVASREITMAVPTVPLGQRRLRLFWLVEDGWSKRARDRAGGIDVILRLIERAQVIEPQKPVCVVINKDDGSPSDDGKVKDVFPKGLVMPHATRGQNRWRTYDQLIYCAALNSYTPDIRYIQQVLGIDAPQQRIGRLGQEVYQTLMRLSLREPNATADVTVVVIDQDVAEWLLQWFEPQDQVEVSEIDASGVIHPRGKSGRPPIGDRAMSDAERKRLSRARQRGETGSERAGK